MSSRSGRLTLVFSSVGHFFIHFFAVYYYLVVLPLEREWHIPYHELIQLWTVGSLLIGVLAMPAGWLADRWRATGMMVTGFVGMGAAAILCGLAHSPTALWVGLCLLGSFAAIYHPVGIPWLVRTAASRGRALGINGIFGSVGVAGAGLIGGLLIDLWGWRMAFILPGVVSVATGLGMLLCLRRGLLLEGDRLAPAAPRGQRTDRIWTFGILLLTMFCGSLIYQSTQAALPKVFALRVGEETSGTLGVGVMIAVVYGIAGMSQIAAGHLADRWPLKTVYGGAFLVQVPLLWVATSLSGLPLVGLATLMVACNSASLPAENMLLADAVPARHQGMAFGLKFVLAFGATPLAIRLVSFINGRTGDFDWLFVVLGGTAALALAAAALIPSREIAKLGETVPASS